MLRRAILVLPLLTYLFAGSAVGQDGVAKNAAVTQMRHIVDAIRQCPGGTAHDFDVAITHQQPPRILEWDVLASDSLRAPFQGYVRFDIPVELQETDEAKQSKELHRKYEFLVTTLSRFAEYRYEFNLSSDAPELRTALFSLHVNSSSEFKPYEPSPNGSCWDKIARSPGSVAAAQPASAGVTNDLTLESKAEQPDSGTREVKKDVSVSPPAHLPATSQLKIVSFAWADSEGVHLGTPKWADDWVQKNAKNFSAIRFSQTPVTGTENYLIVLSASESVLSGFQPVTRINTSTSTADVSGRGTVTDIYGSMWSYTYDGTVTTTTTTMTQEDVPYTIESHTLYASAYGGPANLLISRHSETIGRQRGGSPEGALVYNVEELTRRIRLKTRLLNAVVKDILKVP